MQCTIFANAAHFFSRTAGFAANFFRSTLTKLIKGILWMASTICTLAAGALFLASLTTTTLYAQCDEPDPQQTQPTPKLLSPYRQRYPRCDLAERLYEESVLVTPVPEEMLLEAMEAIEKRLYPSKKPQSWQQWVIAQIQERSDSITEIHVASQQPEDTASWYDHDTKPLNHQLTIQMICWQAFASVAEALKPIKASELKALASDLSIKGYRRMTKSELLVAIASAA